MTRVAAVAVALLLAGSAAGVGWASTAVDPGGVPATADAAPDATIEHEGDRLALAAAGGQVVRGTTTLPPGSEVTVRIRSVEGGHPFLEERRATVDENGEFVVLFSLDGAEPGANFTLRVTGPDGERLVDDLPGRIVEGDVDLGLSDSEISAQRDGAATMSISLDGDDEATLALVGREVNYRLVANVTDGDGDGVVDVRFDTAVAGTDGNPLSATDSADEVALASETGLDSSLPAGDYVVLLGVEESTATATATPTATPDRSGHPEFAEVVTTVHHARTAELPVYLGNASTATVSIGGPSVNYAVEGTVSDGNDDGVVTVEFDTAAAGTDAPTLAAAEAADEVSVTNETDLGSPPLAPGEYPVELYRGDDASEPAVSDAIVVIERLTAGIEGADLAIGTLTVEDPSKTATPTPAPETPDPVDSLQLERTISTGDAGGTVELAVLLGDADAATLSIGGEAVNYVVNATVSDGNGDGAVTVEFDTGAAGTDAPTLAAASDADEVTVTTESDLESPPLAPGEYPVTLFRGDDAGEVVDIGTIILHEPADDPPVSTSTRTPTATDTSTGTVTPTAAATTDSSVGPGVLALGGIALAGIGAAAVLSRRD